MGALQAIMTPTFLRQILSHLKQGHHWGDITLAALGGYAAAMCAWELTHAPALIGFLLTNDLALAARTRLALFLAGGAGAALLLWVVLGWLLARRTPGAALRIAARWVFLAAPLPCLPILSAAATASQPIPRYFLWGTVIALAATIFAVVRGLVLAYAQQSLPDAPAARQTPAPRGVGERGKNASRGKFTKSTNKAGRIGLVVTLALAA
ncbi:MAG: hypothetical protein QG637_992, partial [Chloroflexota bacterium]|nr:hypothetical protein [Chloroflexota bacterium]